MSLAPAPPESRPTGQILVSTHVSTLWDSDNATSIPVTTSRIHSSLPASRSESDPPSEHASQATFFHSLVTGSLTARVLSNGLVLELISLTTSANPLRFAFPTTLLPGPSVLLWQERELHIIAVTSHGSLYRLVIPVYGAAEGALWSEHLPANWCREYQIRHAPPVLQGLVQIQGVDSVVIALPNGGIIRLDADDIGSDSRHDRWSENVFQPQSLLASLTSFLSLSAVERAHVISVASHPPPSDIAHTWTLSRDRTLRLWSSKSGCIASHTLPHSLDSQREMTPANGSPSPAVPLLDPEPQHLLTVFSSDEREDDAFVVVFIPTSSSATSGGYFQLLACNGNHLRVLATFDSATGSAHHHVQDFLVIDGALCVLWDYEGQSVLHSVSLHDAFTSRSKDPIRRDDWEIVRYPYEPDLTPAYLDELLLASGSLTEKFFDAVTRPGIFSPYTLTTATQQYISTYASLPGPTPAALQASYSTIGEAIASIVGCTVSLTRDPATGALQHDRYWAALKRDWEGFVARCRETERSARWPVALGVDNEGILHVLERERIGIVAEEDLALRVHRDLREGVEIIEEHFAACDVAWQLRKRLDARAIRTVETLVSEAVHQEIAYPYPDVVAHMAEKSQVREALGADTIAWFGGAVLRIPDATNLRTSLDLVGGFDRAAKMEDDETEAALLASPGDTGFARALTAAYITHTTLARHELCVAILAMLLSDPERVRTTWDSVILADVLAVFRGISMLYDLSTEPAIEPAPPSGLDTDAVVARLRTLDVSRAHGQSSAPGPSLLWHLFTHYGGPPRTPLPAAAHLFMDATGLLTSVSPAEASASEVLCAERLRAAGRIGASRRLLEWLPRAPGVMYVRSLLWLDIGQDAEAAEAMDCLAGAFGHANALSQDDAAALASVLPSGLLFNSDFQFYAHASGLFKSAQSVEYEVHFAKRAIAAAPLGSDITALWSDVIHGSIELGLWDDAYAALMAAPYDKLKRDCARQLVYRMCEEQAIEQLVRYSFGNLVVDVVDSLSFKARNADPRVRPSYSRILYAWYMARSDFRSAAKVMYQRSRKLTALAAQEPDQYFSLAEANLESLLVCMNALALVDSKHPFIVIAYAPGPGRTPLTKNIPEDRLGGARRDSEYLTRDDILREYTLLSAQLELIRAEPELLANADHLLTAEGVVMRLSLTSRYETALKAARTLKVDASPVFTRLALECVRLSRTNDPVITEGMADWLLTDKATSWVGTWAARAWRYLREALTRHDGPATDYDYAKVVFEAICGLERGSAPPPWLVQTLETHHPEWLIRTAMRFDMLDFALEQTLALFRASNARLDQSLPHTAGVTWLPYTLVDQLLFATSDQRAQSPRGKDLRKQVQNAMSSRLRNMEKITSALG